MHYFQFEIKEWVSNTAHLSLEEEAIYLRLINYYYDSEKAIPMLSNGDIPIFRKLRISNTELAKDILYEFFTEIENGFIHERCDLEIAKYHAKSEQASRAGKASAQRRSNDRSTTVQPIINHKPLTINHKPLNTLQAPEGVSTEIWNDFVAQRKKARAVVSENVVKSIGKEATKAGWTLEQALAECAARGWRGFKAEWVKDKQTTTERGNAVMLGLTRGLVGGRNNGLLSK
jgi:uncharacterized protein YdaU (DUF1376 family)